MLASGVVEAENTAFSIQGYDQVDNMCKLVARSTGKASGLFPRFNTWYLDCPEKSLEAAMGGPQVSQTFRSLL